MNLSNKSTKKGIYLNDIRIVNCIKGLKLKTDGDFNTK